MPHLTCRRPKCQIIRAGTPLYHGSQEPASSEIESSSRLVGRSKYKMNAGALDEGGLIWFTLDKERARRWAESCEIGSRACGPGKVFKFVTPVTLKILDRYMKMDAQQAIIANEVLGIPDYKPVKSGDSLSTAVHRAFDSSQLYFYVYDTPGGKMRAIWPVLLSALGADGFFYHEDSIALSLEEAGVTLGRFSQEWK